MDKVLVQNPINECLLRTLFEYLLSVFSGYLHLCLFLTGHIQSSSGGQRASESDRGKRQTTRSALNSCSLSLMFLWNLSYYERLLVDVVQIQREDIIFAVHIHAVVILIHAKDPVVGRVQQEGEVVSCAGGL